MISNDTSLTVGETALLTCVGYGQSDGQITWNKDGEDVMNSSLVSVYEEEVTLGGRQFKQSFLELCIFEISVAGIYTCTVQDVISASTQLFVSGKILLSAHPDPNLH